MVNKKGWLLFGVSLILFVSILPLISAQGDKFYKQNEDINFAHSVRLNGFPNDNILCNFTAFDPEGITIVEFKQMTYNSTAKTVNYTLNSSQTSKIGQYCYDVTCTVNSFNSTDDFCVEINPTGSEFTISQSVLYMFVLFLSLSLLGLFIYWAYTIPWTHSRDGDGFIIKVNYKKHLKLFFICLSYLMILWISYVTWSITLGYLNFTPVPYFFRFIWRTMLAFMTPIFIAGGIIFFIIFLQDLKLEKAVNRGGPVE